MNNKVFNSAPYLNRTNLTQRMQDLFSRRWGKSRKPFAATMGWTMVPNCKQFNVISQGTDFRWKLSVNLNVSLPPKLEFSPLGHKFNKYINYQTRRLERLRNQPFMYFKTAMLLMLKSKAFRLSAIHRIIPKWYVSTSVKRVIEINKEVDRIIQEGDFRLMHRRVYIPKGDTFRPLGVPTIAWRIYLHMFNNFLFQYMRIHLLDSQHGFIKGRGTMTCWKEVFDKVIDAKFIYECDLKQFFPTVKHTAILYKMMEMGIPEHIFRYLDAINCSTPILPKKKLLDESLTIKKQEEVRINVFGGERNPTPRTLRTGLGMSFGVPQGSPISPLLSNLSLRSFLYQSPSVSYADDPIFYDDKDFSIEGDDMYGIQIHQDKSFWVKRNGTWLTELKYLGLRYNPWKNTITTASRRAKETITLTMPQVISLLKQFKVKGIEKDIKSIHNWSLLFEKGLFGTLMARLYEGKLDSESKRPEIPNIHRNSWMRIHGLTDPFNPTYSSYAAIYLAKWLGEDRIPKSYIRFVYSLNRRLRV